jgi:hypothetical protein
MQHREVAKAGTSGGVLAVRLQAGGQQRVEAVREQRRAEPDDRELVRRISPSALSTASADSISIEP